MKVSLKEKPRQPAHQSVLVETRPAGNALEMMRRMSSSSKPDPKPNPKQKVKPKVKLPDYRKKAKAPSVKTKKKSEPPPRTRADKMIKFIDEYCLKGTSLAPFQRDFLKGLYQADRSGRLHHSRGLLSTARKNGKTTLCAAISMAHIVGPEAGTMERIFCIANSRQQAEIMLEEMYRMKVNDPVLDDLVLFAKSNGQCYHRTRLNYFQALASQVGNLQGRIPRLWIYDEIGQSKDLKLYNSMALAQASHPEPLGIVASTYSDNPANPMGELIKIVKAQKAAGEGKEWHMQVHQADHEDPPYKFATVKKANPAIGHFLNEKTLRNEVSAAKRSPSQLSQYWAYVLNNAIGAENSLLNDIAWQRILDPDLEFLDGNLQGEPCHVGMDLSLGTLSLTGISIWFPKSKTLLAEAWACKDGLYDLESRYNTPFRSWHHAGLLHATDGTIVDIGEITKRMADIHSFYDVKSLRYDIHRAPQFRDAMVRAGHDWNLKMIHSRPATMGPHTEHFVNIVQEGKMKAMDNPLLNFCVSNTTAVSSRNTGNGKDFVIPGKNSLGFPTDLCLSSILACAILEEEPEPEPVSVISLSRMEAEMERIDNETREALA